MTRRFSSDPNQVLRTTAPETTEIFGMSRRRMLAGSGATVVISCPKAGQAESAEPIAQPSTPSPSAFMDRAFEMRRIAVDRGDQAYGAVIVLDNRIVGQSWSRVILDSDPTGHAEVSAIRDAARRLNRRDLSGAVMYSSSRPCPMCEAAAYWAGIGGMIHGQGMRDAGSPTLCS